MPIEGPLRELGIHDVFQLLDLSRKTGVLRVASELRREKWGGIVVSPNGVWKALCRHGLNTRVKRFALVAGYAAPYEPPATQAPSGTSTSIIPASWSGSTASTSDACVAPRGRSGS